MALCPSCPETVTRIANKMPATAAKLTTVSGNVSEPRAEKIRSGFTLKFHRVILNSATGDLNIVERDCVIREFLVGLMPFPRD